MIFLKTVINKTALGLYHDDSPFKSPFNTATLLIQSVFCGSLVIHYGHPLLVITGNTILELVTC